jgi:hypothetical protein
VFGIERDVSAGQVAAIHVIGASPSARIPIDVIRSACDNLGIDEADVLPHSVH